MEDSIAGRVSAQERARARQSLPVLDSIMKRAESGNGVSTDGEAPGGIFSLLRVLAQGPLRMQQKPAATGATPAATAAAAAAVALAATALNAVRFKIEATLVTILHGQAAPATLLQPLNALLADPAQSREVVVSVLGVVHTLVAMDAGCRLAILGWVDTQAAVCVAPLGVPAGLRQSVSTNPRILSAVNEKWMFSEQPPAPRDIAAQDAKDHPCSTLLSALLSWFARAGADTDKDHNLLGVCVSLLQLLIVECSGSHLERFGPALHSGALVSTIVDLSLPLALRTRALSALALLMPLASALRCLHSAPTKAAPLSSPVSAVPAAPTPPASTRPNKAEILALTLFELLSGDVHGSCCDVVGLRVAIVRTLSGTLLHHGREALNCSSTQDDFSGMVMWRLVVMLSAQVFVLLISCLFSRLNATTHCSNIMCSL